MEQEETPRTITCTCGEDLDVKEISTHQCPRGLVASQIGARSYLIRVWKINGKVILDKEEAMRAQVKNNIWKMLGGEE